MPVVVATIVPNPGQLDAVEAIYKQIIGSVHEEDGCELYALHRAKDRLVFIEKWRDMDALKAHGAGSILKDVHERLEGLVDSETVVQILRPVPSGDAEKGAL
jgi:quinol monooxygenase YgiN